MFAVIIPAHNEDAWIGATLEALLAQDEAAPADLRVIVAANGCTDSTVSVAQRFAGPAAERGWGLTVLDLPDGNKTAALNAAEALLVPGPRIFIDADIRCAPDLIGQIARALDRPEPVYASGTFSITPPRSWASHHYARLWLKVPFMRNGVPGAGVFAVNAAGRTRWEAFPDVIADDLFVRLMFSPAERVAVPSPFQWPLAEGFAGLVRVRRRWNAGNAQLAAHYPDLAENEDKVPVRLRDHLRLFAGQPVSYLVYVAVALAAKCLPAASSGWERGR